MKITKSIRHLLLVPALLSLAFSGTALAGDDDNSTGLTEADRTAMAEGAQKYRLCLHQEAQAVMDKYSDVRKVADVALKKCAPQLETLETQLKASKDISPELAAGFVHYSANMGARRLLKELIEERAAAASAAR